LKFFHSMYNFIITLPFKVFSSFSTPRCFSNMILSSRWKSTPGASLHEHNLMKLVTCCTCYLIHNALQGAMQQHEEIVDKISKHDHSLVHIPSTGHPVKMIGMPFNQLVYKQLDLPLLLSGRTQRKCQSTERLTQNCTSVPTRARVCRLVPSTHWKLTGWPVGWLDDLTHRL
jgi:hypothetical protein